MSRHQFDLVQCMKRPGTHIGFLCSQCDGKCPVCDSFVKPAAQVRVCDGCTYGHLAHRCILCGNHFGEGTDQKSPAFYCHECVIQEKHRDGCPRIVNVGSSKMDSRFNKRGKALT